MKRSLALFLSTFGLLSSLAVARTADPVPDHLTEATRLVDVLKPEQTEYRHRPSVMHWPDEKEGSECRTDCSGFVDLLLRHTYPWATKEWLETTIGKKRPLAGDYYDAIQGHHGFDPVENVADVAPGDFIVMKYPVDSDNTGHIMLVSAKPTPRRAVGPLQDGTKQYDVAVIDETSVPHGKTDSRYEGPGVKNGGLGRGTFRLYTDMDGKFAGYAWSATATNKFYGPDTRPMIVGRLQIPGK